MKRTHGIWEAQSWPLHIWSKKFCATSLKVIMRTYLARTTSYTHHKLHTPQATPCSQWYGAIQSVVVPSGLDFVAAGGSVVHYCLSNYFIWGHGVAINSCGSNWKSGHPPLWRTCKVLCPWAIFTRPRYKFPLHMSVWSFMIGCKVTSKRAWERGVSLDMDHSLQIYHRYIMWLCGKGWPQIDLLSKIMLPTSIFLLPNIPHSIAH